MTTTLKGKTGVWGQWLEKQLNPSEQPATHNEQPTKHNEQPATHNKQPATHNVQRSVQSCIIGFCPLWKDKKG